MSEGSVYQKTLQLPVTDFPMRGNLPKREPDMLKRWDDEDYYGQLQNLAKSKIDLCTFCMMARHMQMRIFI